MERTGSLNILLLKILDKGQFFGNIIFNKNRSITVIKNVLNILMLNVSIYSNILFSK